MKAETLRTLAQHALFVCVFLGLWEWGARAGWVDPSFMGSPLGIITFTLENLTNARLWGDLGYTLLAVFASFVIGSVAAMVTGLAFVTWPKFEAFCDPYISAFNVLPRIALVPLFILWFGLGIGSKIALGVSLTFFIVLSSTVAGIRGVSQDHVTQQSADVFLGHLARRCSGTFLRIALGRDLCPAGRGRCRSHRFRAWPRATTRLSGIHIQRQWRVVAAF
jgi:NitT/TauT family transport system permease protein